MLETNGGQQFYFSSDWHLGHKKILEYSKAVRKFDTVEEMDQQIIDNVNECVRSKDVLVFVGDFAWDYGNDNTIGDYLNRIKCNQIHVVLGNHDRNHQAFRDHRKVASVSQIKEFKINKVKIIACHYPMLSWNGSHYGSIHVHGHIHANINGWLNQAHSSGPRLNVCTELHDFRPLSLDEIVSLCKYKGPNWDNVKNSV